MLKIVGDGANMVDITYIDNVAHAHWLAAKNLCSSATAGGKAYFIGQERPVKMWDWINDLFSRMGIPPVSGKISLPTALAVGAVLEMTHKLLFPEKEPRMTRFLAEQLAKSHYFSHDRARHDLGYFPIVPIEEGMDKLIHWLRDK
jgi:nucleoside-diphosphate-sugar epimerase